MLTSNFPKNFSFRNLLGSHTKKCFVLCCCSPRCDDNNCYLFLYCMFFYVTSTLGNLLFYRCLFYAYYYSQVITVRLFILNKSHNGAWQLLYRHAISHIKHYQHNTVVLLTLLSRSDLLSRSVTTYKWVLLLILTNVWHEGWLTKAIHSIRTIIICTVYNKIMYVNSSAIYLNG